MYVVSFIHVCKNYAMVDTCIIAESWEAALDIASSFVVEKLLEYDELPEELNEVEVCDVLNMDGNYHYDNWTVCISEPEHSYKGKATVT